jgi:hypothetical protein
VKKIAQKWEELFTDIALAEASESKPAKDTIKNIAERLKDILRKRLKRHRETHIKENC